MSQKCPVIISNKSALKEINNNSALYFDPDKIDEIEYLISKTLKIKNLRKKLIKKGLHHSRKFSWQTTLSKTQKILDI